MKRWWLVLMVAVGVIGMSSSGWCDSSQLKYRWLFVWRDLTQPEQVDQTIAQIPRAAADGYNGFVLNWHIAPGKVEHLKAEAAKYHIDLIPTVMGGVPDRNLYEGLPVKDALFVAHGGTATLVPDPAAVLPGGSFEQANGDTFAGWDSQESPGKCTFADRSVKHGGAASLRMDHLDQAGRDSGCYIGRTVKVKPYHEYRVSVWAKTDKLQCEEPGIVIRGLGRNWRGLSYTRAEIDPTQDWKQHFVIFNSLDNTEVRISFGVWAGRSGRIWWDDAVLEEVGLLNVLRRPGTPVVVKGEDGTVYQEGTDYAPVSDPNLHIWLMGHQPPVITLTPNSRIAEGQRLLVSYYHPVLIEYGASACFSDPRVYDFYREEIKQANDLLHPPAFFMSHDEIRIANWCEACQSRHLTPGQLLADNVKRCADIIKEIRPDAKIWVWSDMFDPFHNAHEHYYLVNGTWAGSWEGLPKEVGIANWAVHLAGRNLYWFSMRGHEQVLCGYYDSPADQKGEHIRGWLKEGEGIPGIVGAMYTTWQTKYDAMDDWAKAAWGGK
jgi:hypothetical protein